MQRRRWPWVRIVLGVVAVVLLIFGVSWLFESVDYHRRAVEAEAAELIHLEVDLSKPGTYAGTLAKAFPPAHSHALLLKTDPCFNSQEAAEAAFQGLTGHLTIVDPQGETVFDNDLNATSFYARGLGDGTWEPTLIAHGHFPDQPCQLTLVVDIPASNLDGVPQVLVGRNFFCGVEFLVGYIVWWLGIISCMLAGILGFLVVVITVAVRRRQPATSAPADSTTE
jgi:hypothetical protein